MAAGQPGMCRATIRDLCVGSSEDVGYWPDYFSGAAGVRSLLLVGLPGPLAFGLGVGLGFSHGLAGAAPPRLVAG